MPSNTGVKTPWLPSIAHRKIYGLAFLVGSLGISAWVFERHYPVFLALEASAPGLSEARLFFNGYREPESRAARIVVGADPSWRTLKFDLPHVDLTDLRVHLSSIAGVVGVRNATITCLGAKIAVIPAADILALDQISNRIETNGDVQFSTAVGARDPSLTFRLHAPVQLKKAVLRLELRSLLLWNLCWAAAMVVAFVFHLRVAAAALFVERAVWRKLCCLTKKLDRYAGDLGRRSSVPGFIEFDSWAVWFYATCLLLCSTGGLANLNGSSIGSYSETYGNGAPAKIWLGGPRAVRSDEWAYYTPDIFNQALRLHRFEAANSEFGGHSVALAANVPVWHVSTLLRPRFWVFFVLPADYAFAFFWQFKAFLLVVGLFTFFLFLTGSTLWAATGSLWYFFSPFTQWSYSWASDLPEMIGLACLTIVLACYLTVGKNAAALALASIVTVLCAVDFAMTAYLPHLIPLCWFAVLFFLVWLLSEYRQIFVRTQAGYRMLALFACVCLVGITGWTVYRDLSGAITAIGNTSYPGRRVIAGGSVPIWYLSSQFLQWSEWENHFPAALSNVCEGSGFLWLAPVTLCCWPRLRLSRFNRFAMVCLWSSALLFTAWLVLPLPAAFGKLSGFDKSPVARMLPALGLANIGLVVLCMSSMARYIVDRGRRLSLKVNLAATAISLAAMLALLTVTNYHLDGFFSPFAITVSAIAAGVLVVLVLNGSQLTLALALVVPQAICFGTVNPLERGMDVVTSSDLYKFVRSNPRLLDGKWIVYSKSVAASGFVAATGCDVYTGIRYLPDIDNFPVFARYQLDVSAFNRLGYLNALLPPDLNQPTRVKVIGVGTLEWEVAPTDPILREIGIKYAAVRIDQDAASFAARLIPLADKPVDGYWLYQLPER